MAGLSSAQLAKIDSALKRANTRIARLEDSFGRQSSTFKTQIARFEKGPLHKYTGESKSGHWKLDKGKIMKDIRSGRLNPDQANEILRNAAGIRIDPSGEVRESNWGGFQTREQIFKQTIQNITTTDVDLSEFEDEKGNININKETLREITEKLNSISESFQTEYQESPLTEVEMKKDPLLSMLYSSENGGSRRRGQKLSYGELQAISKRLGDLRADIDKMRQSGLANHENLTNY